MTKTLQQAQHKPVILTGIRANNDLHLGNYLGGLQPIVDLQRIYAGEYQVNLFVPDLHSFTTPIDHSQLNEQISNNLRLFVAAGLDLSNPDTYLYRQSYVPAHSELAIILGCFAHMGEMSRMTQYKDKAHGNDAVSVGLFTYPILMAADILLYGAQYVPLGDDQNQHIEITRDVAMRMNEKFKAQFPDGLFRPPLGIAKQVEFVGRREGVRIRDLVDPTKKMSKSDETGKGVIFLTDDPAVAKKKIMGATTDSYARVAYNRAEQPGLANLIDILALIDGRGLGDVCKQFVGQQQYGPLKTAVAEAVGAFLTDFQARLAAVDVKAMNNKLVASEAVMNTQAKATLLKVQQAVGLRPKT